MLVLLCEVRANYSIRDLFDATTTGIKAIVRDKPGQYCRQWSPSWRSAKRMLCMAECSAGLWRSKVLTCCLLPKGSQQTHLSQQWSNKQMMGSVIQGRGRVIERLMDRMVD